MAPGEDENREFEELDDLFSEEATEADPLADPDLTEDADLDLGELASEVAEEGGLEDLPEGDPLEELSEEDQPADAVEEEQPEEEDDNKEGKAAKKKKRKKKRKDKKKLRKKDPRPKRDLDEDEKEGGGLLGAVANLDVFTVMLGLSLLAILIAVFCLWMEWGEYGREIKAKRPMVTAPVPQFGPASTTVAAWPTCVQFSSRAGEPGEESGSPRIT